MAGRGLGKLDRRESHTIIFACHFIKRMIRHDMRRTVRIDMKYGICNLVLKFGKLSLSFLILEF